MLIYNVILQTTCRACAMALAGHAMKIAQMRAITVKPREEGEPMGVFVIHQNGGGMYMHDGMPFACPEHGGITDTRQEPVVAVSPALPPKP